jgi:perosamine synthetase
LKKFIPVNKPLITKTDADKVYSALKGGWVSSEGPNVKKFEKKFSNFIGHKYSVAVSSGTAALEIAVKSLNLKKNDEVIIPNFTIISNALAVIKLGLKIKLIDCDLKNWNMNIQKIENAITTKTKAIIATHIYNFPLRVDLLKKICKKKKIFIIEDAAEALGQKIYNKNCGSFGDISTFSFYANKQVTTGEGGMITTNNKFFHEKMLSLRNLSFGKKNRFNHDDIGWNYRMTNIQATLGISQLTRIKNIIKNRHDVGLQYYNNLKKNMNIFIPEPKKKYAKNIYWVIAILITNKKINLDAKKAMYKLNKLGIGTRPFFWPMHKQKILKNFILQGSKKFPHSEYISKYGFYLPSSLSLKKAEINYICKKVNLIFK